MSRDIVPASAATVADTEVTAGISSASSWKERSRRKRRLVYLKRGMLSSRDFSTPSVVDDPAAPRIKEELIAAMLVEVEHVIQRSGNVIIGRISDSAGLPIVFDKFQD